MGLGSFDWVTVSLREPVTPLRVTVWWMVFKTIWRGPINEEMGQQMMAAAELLASATEALDRVLGKMDAQQEMLNAKVDRIVAAVEESIMQNSDQQHVEAAGPDLRERLAGLEKSNAELKAQAARLT